MRSTVLPFLFYSLEKVHLCWVEGMPSTNLQSNSEDNWQFSTEEMLTPKRHHPTSPNILNQQLLTCNLTEIKEEIFTYNLKTTIRVKLADVTCVKPTLTISIDFKGFSCFFWVFVITQSHTGSSNDNLSSGIWFVVLSVISYWKTRGGIMVA